VSFVGWRRWAGHLGYSIGLLTDAWQRR